jgi:hypothetical protein
MCQKAELAHQSMIYFVAIAVAADRRMFVGSSIDMASQSLAGQCVVGARQRKSNWAWALAMARKVAVPVLIVLVVVGSY